MHCFRATAEDLQDEGKVTGEILVTGQEEEESFPRGGRELLTPLEKNIISKQAKQDLLFQEVS